MVVVFVRLLVVFVLVLQHEELLALARFFAVVGEVGVLLTPKSFDSRPS